MEFPDQQREMLHLSCNIGIRDVPDMCVQSPRDRVLGIHIRQINHAYVYMLQLLHITQEFLLCLHDM